MRFSIFVFLLLGCGSVFAQNYAGNWLLGFDSSTGLPEYGGSTLVFQPDSILTYGQSRNLNFLETGTSMSDSLGNLLFYTNGVAVVNAAGDTLENGGGISPSVYTDVYAHTGIARAQTTLALPDPADSTDSRYFLFVSNTNPDNFFVSNQVEYNHIDMSAAGGTGALLTKNQTAIQDTFAFLEPMLTAVRHGNGRDWWLFVSSDTAAYYHRVLVSPEGIGQQQTQVGDFYQPNLSVDFGQNVFSPDGRYFIDHNQILGTRIFDFDRCTGELSNMRYLYEDYFSRIYSTGGGAAVSPDSRYLYISAKRHIYQFDLEAEDIYASRIEVAEMPDTGFESPYTPYFYQMQLGIDGKIYINSTNGVDVLHVIDRPDKAGVECSVLLNAVKLPHWNFRSLPTFPNYRLYDLHDSPCDTLGIDRAYEYVSAVEEPVTRREIRLFPNPTSAGVTIELPGVDYQTLTAEVIDLTGKTALRVATRTRTAVLNLKTVDLPEGIYFVRVRTDREEFAVKKLVIAR